MIKSCINSKVQSVISVPIARLGIQSRELLASDSAPGNCEIQALAKANGLERWTQYGMYELAVKLSVFEDGKKSGSSFELYIQNQNTVNQIYKPHFLVQRPEDQNKAN